MTDQLAQWKGSLGDQYTKSNLLETNSAVPYYERILGIIKRQRPERPAPSVLEVGCNVGGKLMAMLKAIASVYPETTLGDLRSGKIRLFGVEPNKIAWCAAFQLPFVQVAECDAYILPFGDASFDLVFTSGVLTHIPDERLGDAMREIYRVSREYILAVEYFAEVDRDYGTYRSTEHMLWLRDYARHYRSLFPGMALEDSGLYREWVFGNDCKWWFFRKPVTA